MFRLQELRIIEWKSKYTPLQWYNTSSNNRTLSSYLLLKSLIFLLYLAWVAKVKSLFLELWGCIYNKWGDSPPSLWLLISSHDSWASMWLFKLLWNLWTSIWLFQFYLWPLGFHTLYIYHFENYLISSKMIWKNITTHMTLEVTFG